MDRKAIERTVRLAIIAVKSQYMDFENREFTDGDLLKDLHMDSLDVMEAIMCVETSLKIKIPNREIHDINTFGDLCNLIEKNTA